MDPIFERLNCIETALEAERELISLGDAALGRLEALFNGTSRNRWGIPYRNLGLTLQCALEVATRLGPVAKPLEPFLAAELPNCETAARALGALGNLTPPSVDALVMALEADFFVASEAALALVKCGQDRILLVKRVEEQCAAAKKHLQIARLSHSRTQ